MVVMASLVGLGLGLIVGFIREFINNSDLKKNNEKIKLIEESISSLNPFKKYKK